MNRNEIVPVENESRTRINTVMFMEMEFDCISHFHPRDQWFRVRDRWGNVGWCVGYRDWVKAECQPHNAKVELGFGGQVYIFYDHDGSVGFVEPEAAERI